MPPLRKLRRDDAGWHRMPDPEGPGHAPRVRASGQMERYLPGDGRVEVADCHHTQILDVQFPITARCLDCGIMLTPGVWNSVPGIPELTDTTLTEHRRRFNDVWFDQTYKLHPGDPDDPAEEAARAADRRKKGIERL